MVQIVNLLVEGVGVRAIERLTGANRNTVLNVLETVGAKCQDFIDAKIRNVAVESVQCDELFCFVHSKETHNHTDDPERGTQYVFLAVDRKSKLILSYQVGKRVATDADAFLLDLKKRVPLDTQITTDGFQGYLGAMYDAFAHRVHFAQQIKTYADYGTQRTPKGKHRRYSPEGVTSIRTLVHIGTPDPLKISTSHVERTNLTLRLFNRRFTRLTLGYSKKLANLKFSIALFIAHFNWCRVHSTIQSTPAEACGLADHRWTIEELLTATIS